MDNLIFLNLKNVCRNLLIKIHSFSESNLFLVKAIFLLYFLMQVLKMFILFNSEVPSLAHLYG